MDSLTIGRELRARRTAAGRTVASVAADAGLSVPYIANLENGRGNPTTTALTRLAEALGMRLAVTLVPDESVHPGDGVPAPAIPASLVRLGRTARFRQAAAAMAAALERDAGEFSGGLVAALALLGQAMGRELAEADWWRLLDALLLIAAHPTASLPLASGPGGGRDRQDAGRDQRGGGRDLGGLASHGSLASHGGWDAARHFIKHKVAEDGKGWVESRFAHGFSIAAGKPGSEKVRRDFRLAECPRCPSN